MSCVCVYFFTVVTQDWVFFFFSIYFPLFRFCSFECVSPMSMEGVGGCGVLAGSAAALWLTRWDYTSQERRHKRGYRAALHQSNSNNSNSNIFICSFLLRLQTQNAAPASETTESQSADRTREWKWGMKKTENLRGKTQPEHFDWCSRYNLVPQQSYVWVLNRDVVWLCSLIEVKTPWAFC